MHAPVQEDLSLPNHLIGLKQLYLKLSFLNVHDLMHVKSKIMPRIRKNREQEVSISCLCVCVRGCVGVCVCVCECVSV